MVAAALGDALDREPDMRVVGVVGTLDEALASLRSAEVLVVLLDLRLAGVDDASVYIAELRVASPGDVRVIVLTGAADHWSITAAFTNGCDGYLIKNQPIGELTAAIRSVANGRRVTPPGFDSGETTSADPALDVVGTLSPREIEVLSRLAAGTSTKELAAELFLSVNTVRNHVQRAIEKLGAHNRLEAVSIARRAGVIRPD